MTCRTMKALNDGFQEQYKHALSSQRNMLFAHIMFIIKSLSDNGDSLVMNDGDLVELWKNNRLMYNYE